MFSALANHVEVGRIPGLLQIGDIVLAPVADPVFARRDVRHAAFAPGIRRAGEFRVLGDATEQVARGVALPA
jgi:hypothetical protein